MGILKKWKLVFRKQGDYVDLIIHWINQHGYIVLFFVPMLELIFLPVSAEVVMGYGGVLVFQGKLNLDRL
jgi:membrane protein DedA with SNARE-associated domain